MKLNSMYKRKGTSQHFNIAVQKNYMNMRYAHKYAYGVRFVVICSGLALVDPTNNLWQSSDYT